MKYNKGFASLVLVAIIVGALAIGGGAYYLGKNSNNKEVKVEEKNVLQENQIVNDSQKDYSDEVITINENQNPILTTLPAKYIRAQEGWPPVIKHIQGVYSCNIGTKNPDINEKTVQKTINGRTYCIGSSSEGAAGSSYLTYTYTTASSNGNGSETTKFALKYSNCGVYRDNSINGGVQYNECKTTQSNFTSNLDNLIDSLMSK